MPVHTTHRTYNHPNHTGNQRDGVSFALFICHHLRGYLYSAVRTSLLAQRTCYTFIIAVSVMWHNKSATMSLRDMQCRLSVFRILFGDLFVKYSFQVTPIPVSRDLIASLTSPMYVLLFSISLIVNECYKIIHYLYQK